MEPQPGAPLASPRPALRVVDAVALTVGLVVGAGIFKTPSLVAANAGSAQGVLWAWLLGGVVSVVGALCYAELATAYPHPGGDYHYLHRALGRGPAFLFAWSRLTVIPTGSVALLAFVFGDYASQLLRLGPHSSALYAGLLVVALTLLNVLGLRHGTRTQNLLTLLEVGGLLALVAVGLFVAPAASPGPAPAAVAGAAPAPAWGLVMVFVLLTYGGWNEAAYLSAEVKGRGHPLLRALLWSLGIVTLLYLLVNAALLRGLGVAAMGQSEAVAADLMQRGLGTRGALVLSALIALSALTSANATLFTAARTNYALGRDFPAFRLLGSWNARTGSPVNALLVQGAITLALVLLGSATRQGFQTMVEYTAPVFWLFFLLTGVSLFVLRRREPHARRPFRVPLYPLSPLLFCATCAYLLYASLAYTGLGALVGVAVLGLGTLVLAAGRSTPLWRLRRRTQEAT
jgi:basic amino acid/polyamine antiporter, APA family